MKMNKKISFGSVFSISTDIAYSFTDRTVYVLSDYPGCELKFAGLFYE